MESLNLRLDLSLFPHGFQVFQPCPFFNVNIYHLNWKG